VLSTLKLIYNSNLLLHTPRCKVTGFGDKACPSLGEYGKENGNKG